jgi:RNA polymerase sigma factor (sigma-70 family)
VSKKTVQPDDAGAFLESNLPLIEAVVAEVARRQRVRGDQLDEFRSLAFLKLIEHDYAVLRRFEGASSLRTYLTVVLHRVLLDQRNREWGRWRPSAAAYRNGPLAVRLERLVTRDGLTLAEAIAAVGPDADPERCAAWVRGLRGRSAVRGSRSTLGEDAIPECADPSPGPDLRAQQRERDARALELRRIVHHALRTLDSQDHLILTLHFRDGLSVADVARVLGLPAKPLYRRLDRILARLHSRLCIDEAGEALARELAGDLWSDAVPAGEYGWWRPSNPVGGSEPAAGGMGRGDLPRSRAARGLHRRPGAPAHSARATSV